MDGGIPKCGEWAPIDERTVINLGENLWRENGQQGWLGVDLGCRGVSDFKTGVLIDLL